MPESAHEVPQAPAMFENRPFILTEPEAPIMGVLVYLHGARVDPLEGTSAITEIRKYASVNGYLLVQPQGSIECTSLGIMGAGSKVCWDLRDIAEEVAFLTRLVNQVGQRFGDKLENRVMLGYSNGGFLLGGALQRGLGGSWERVGIIAGGTVGDEFASPGSGPSVHIDIGTDDRWQLQPSRQLRDAIGHIDPKPSYREAPHGHAISAARMREFLSWWSAAPAAAGKSLERAQPQGATP